jgi:DHA1 family tetracycline resistance protein-like MFS transporter
MEKFHWDERAVGLSLSFVGLVTSIVQAGLIRIIIPKIGQQRGIYVGLGLYCIGFVLFAFATQGWMMYAFLIPYCLGSIAGPSLQGVISTQVPPNVQGELQGGLTSLMSATAIVSPPIMTTIFAYFTAENTPFYFPGASMLTGAILTCISALLAYRILRSKKIDA